jgi:hypothetical protein
MKLMVLKPFKLKTKDGPKLYQPGEVFETLSPKAQVYIREGFFKAVEEPRPPLRPGWVVAFKDKHGRIDGGTVRGCSSVSGGWSITLSDGRTFRDREILSVGRIENGQWLASWTVKVWGLDGDRKVWPAGVKPKGKEVKQCA